MLDSRALLFIAGLIAFVAGLAIVLTHNVWVAGWPVIITIFGWASLFAGIIRIVFPDQVAQLGRRAADSQGFLLFGIVLYLGLGAWLIYAGYVHRRRVISRSTAAMNVHDKTIKRTEVTTGPLTGSRKVYSAPDGHDDLARAVPRDRARQW